jgi:hypothetical protein
MPMTLDEMLALLPDNNTGAIDAIDIRTIVTELYNAAHTAFTVHAYRITSGYPPNSGQIAVDQWATIATSFGLQMSEVDGSGIAFPFALIDNSAASGLRIIDEASGAELTCVLAPPSVDQGTWRDVIVSSSTATGTAPLNNRPITVVLVTQLS